MNESILHEAREIVRTQPMNLYVGHLKTCADQLHEAYDILKVSCSREAATNFVAAFTRTVVAIERVHEFVPPTPSGGRMTVPQAREEKAVTGQA
jgi:hypothetical protein